MSLAGDWQTLLDFLKISADGRRSKAAALTFLVCDILSTWGQERRYIWRSAKWTPAKVAYIVARYYAFPYITVNLIVASSQHSLEFCKAYSPFFNFGGDILYTVVVNTISTLRIYALYNRSKKILLFFLFWSALEFALEFYLTYEITVLSVKNTFNLPIPIPQVTGCLTYIPNTVRTLIAWVPCIFVAFLFFVFTIWKFRESVIGHGGEMRMSALRNPDNISPLLAIFVRDGGLFFGLIFVMISVQATFSLYRGAWFHPLFHPWLHVTYSCACARLVLNLHSYGGTGAATSLHTLTALDTYPMESRPSQLSHFEAKPGKVPTGATNMSQSTTIW